MTLEVQVLTRIMQRKKNTIHVNFCRFANQPNILQEVIFSIKIPIQVTLKVKT